MDRSYPTDGNGDCDFETAIEVARNAPCEQLELLEAELVEEIDD